MKKILVLIFMLMSYSVFAQKTQIALLKYRGGGDWYSNPTSLPNLVKFCNQSINTDISTNIATVDAGSPDIFNYPFVHMTGHGNVVFNDSEAENIRNYLIAGGFLHIDDNYGIKDFAMSQMQKVFPELQWVELPYSHPVFQKPYSFPDGLPKIHEHDNKAPQAFVLIYEERIVFTIETTRYFSDSEPKDEDRRIEQQLELIDLALKYSLDF